ncbi:alpha/beta hydrolase family protein [Deinococcus sedimenti]|uniref:Chlorophyllase n=1 Tax=Deinococcus sedimenti TaxID=1867090 RepID=A0ABQ2SBY3_9DEIO|nr:chlorophyllase [Deinococcus sedimenti]GGS09653.1 hypothetical protein GCM10008960_39910 [Deinococcus sedimenti]
MTAPTAPVHTTAPLLVTAPGRPRPLHVKLSVPLSGDRLPILLFSHGNGSSLHAYGPLTDRWAAQGFAVIQPTHLDSRQDPGPPLSPLRIWRERILDLQRILDHLGELTETLPHVSGRLDPTRVAAAGHSWGGETVSKLLGARPTTLPRGPDDGTRDPRIRAGVLLAAPGLGGSALTTHAAQHYPFLNQDFSSLHAPALIVAGDQDEARLSVRGARWVTDAYHLSSGPKALLTLTGAQHSLGGIPGYESRETTDEQPDRVAAIARLSGAYLRSALDPHDPAWRDARDTFREQSAHLGRIEERLAPTP